MGIDIMEITKELIIELDNSKIDNMTEEEIKKYIDRKLWDIVSDVMRIEDKEYRATDTIEESQIYIYSPGLVHWDLQPDMAKRLEQARKLNKRIVRVDILDRDIMPDKTTAKIKVTEE